MLVFLCVGGVGLVNNQSAQHLLRDIVLTMPSVFSCMRLYHNRLVIARRTKKHVAHDARSFLSFAYAINKNQKLISSGASRFSRNTKDIAHGRRTGCRLVGRTAGIHQCVPFRESHGENAVEHIARTGRIDRPHRRRRNDLTR